MLRRRRGCRRPLRYVIDGARRPDPASRFQPDGVHGPSEVIDPDRVPVAARQLAASRRDNLVIYELHVGTFTRRGTFAAARERLPDAARARRDGDRADAGCGVPRPAQLGLRRRRPVRAVAQLRPARRPARLRRRRARARPRACCSTWSTTTSGPEGAYLPQFHPEYITDRRATPWGGAINLDGPGARDDPPLHRRQRAALGARVPARRPASRRDACAARRQPRAHRRRTSRPRSASAAGRPLAIIAEDHRNLTALVEPRDARRLGARRHLGRRLPSRGPPPARR